MSILFKLGIAGLLLAALAAGFVSYRDSQRDIGRDAERLLWQGRLTEQKTEAQTVLQEAQDKLAASDKLLTASIKALGDQREKLQAANRADLAKYAATHRLQFRTQEGDGGGRGGGVITTTSEAGTSIHAAATFVQLPEKVNDDLFSLAGDAQSLLIDYKVLYEYVHDKKLVCSLRKDK